MIKPQHLKRGDKVAVVSLSSGMLGEKWALHKLEIARTRLEGEFGLKVVVMPNALKGIDFLYKNPQARAKDFMDAFKDKSIKAIIAAIGGTDTIRLLPYIDFEVIKNNPKIFMGFSDTTINHFMCYKAGLKTFYGGSLMNNWAEYIKINDYTRQALVETFFSPVKEREILPSKTESFESDKVWWKEENINVARKFYPNKKGYQVLQGKGNVKGRLLGGCLDSFVYMLGTCIWPNLDEWKDKILFIETSDSDMSESDMIAILRNLQAQGIFDVIKGIIVGKPAIKDKYEVYKKVLKQVVGCEANKPDLPIIYNVNFGHAEPIGIIPYGAMCQLDCDKKTITMLESATK